MQILINPGSGPVNDATEKNATENIKHFITDCEGDGIEWLRLPKKDYGEGRFAFLLYKDTRCHEIQMPGLLLDRVRYMSDEQNIFDFPRLYVNGSSYVWMFALLNQEDFEAEY